MEAFLLALELVLARRETREPAACQGDGGLARPRISDVPLVLLEAQQPGCGEGAGGLGERGARGAGEAAHQTGGHLSG